MSNEINYPIKVVSQKTGLSPHVIRVWERRYQAIEPVRTDTNRRRYSEAELERLTLLGRITASGHGIGSVAGLPMDALRNLADATPPIKAAIPSEFKVLGVALCLESVRQMDGSALTAVLRQQLVSLGHQGLLLKVIAPLAQELGERWQAGEITAAHEHFATAVIRDFLRTSGRPFGMMDGTRRMVVATPTGQMHELGAILAASAAESIGWQVTYLGISLPAAEIAGAATDRQAGVVALSLVFPENDANLRNELVQLRQYLPAAVKIVAGGRAALAYAAALDEIGAKRVATLKEFYDYLAALRQS